MDDVPLEPEPEPELQPDLQTELEPELEYNEEELDVDGGSAPGSMEEGELEDSEPEATESRADDPRRRRAERFGLNLSGPDASDVAQKRAKRFGLNSAGTDAGGMTHRRGNMFGLDPVRLDPVDAAQRRTLYDSLDLSQPEDGPVQWRPEAVHVRGTETMAADDIMAYFAQFRPVHVEWVGHDSCNVVWLDERGPVRALLELSSPIAVAAVPAPDPDALLVGLDHMDSGDADDTKAAGGDVVMREVGEEAVDRADIKAAVPAGRWRLGVPHRLAQNLFLRFATRGDKMLPGAEQRSQHYKLYGNPAHRGVAGIITERRRRELRGETAVDLPLTSDKPNPWGGIAATWATAEAVSRPGRDFDHDPELNLLRDGGRPPDLRRRLAAKADHVERPSAPPPRKRHLSTTDDEGNSSDEAQWRARLKAPRMRMHADDECARTAAPRPASTDLRSRLVAGGGRWRKNAELPGNGERPRHSSPPRLDYELAPAASPDWQAAASDEDEDELTLRPTELAADRPVNIKITRDFSGDELSGAESAADEADSAEDDAALDRRTDRNSAADLRARLNRRRAGGEAGRPPLRIEVDNDEYYRLIGSGSE